MYIQKNRLVYLILQQIESIHIYTDLTGDIELI